MYQKQGKRILDILISGICLLVFSPVFLLLAICVKLDSKGPVFFTQKRIGIHKTRFNILKFRTMRIDTPHDMPTHLLENSDKWITGMGRILRRTSLDELPQLVNIFRGEMSFVGPRPALWNQDDLIALRDKVGANDVVPGLTGWAQVNGRDSISLQEKARLDGEYAQNISFRMDMKCIWYTFAVVVRKEGFQEGKRNSDSSDRK